MYETWMEDGSQPRLDPITFGADRDKNGFIFYFYFL